MAAARRMNRHSNAAWDSYRTAISEVKRMLDYLGQVNL